MQLICGIFQLDGAVASEKRLHGMVEQMNVPRLHPSLCIWRDGPVALAILDFSKRGGPASALLEQHSLIMAADVRLDEPMMLRQAVGAAAATSENALLLAALEMYGPAGLDRVLGDFAFASWNRRTHRLTCGRDALGIRP